jgi:glycopeptide antibiotics resistance protein
VKRTVLWAVYAVYLIAVGYLVWDPDPTAAPWAVYHLTAYLNRIGIGIEPSLVEFGLNVLMFVPMSFLGAFIVPRLRIADWVLIGFVASFAVEIVQKALLPTRTGSTRDIVSNTTGALLGAILAKLWISRHRWLRSERSERLEATHEGAA